jgi:acyl-CoA synthetase (NDP forming)
MWQRIRDDYTQARLDGLLVQTMERGLAEAIIGYKHDEQVGPLVLVGAWAACSRK